MPSEERRGCGYRQIGGLYLVCDPLELIECDRDPKETVLERCQCCGRAFKFSRSIQTFAAKIVLGTHDGKECTCPKKCLLCNPPDDATTYLMWVGRKWYTPQSFKEEARRMGISKRIGPKSIPRDFVIGKSVVYLAMRSIHEDPETGEKKDAVFVAFRPSRIEAVVSEDEDEEVIKKLEEKGFTVVKVKPEPLHMTNPGKVKSLINDDGDERDESTIRVKSPSESDAGRQRVLDEFFAGSEPTGGTTIKGGEEREEVSST